MADAAAVTREEGATQRGDLGLALRGESEHLGAGIEQHAEERDLLRGVHGLVLADGQAELGEDAHGRGEPGLELLLGVGEVQHVVDVAAVLDALAPQLEADDGEQQLAEARCRGQAERHALELVHVALEGEAKMLAEVGAHVKGEEAVGKVSLAVPAAGRAVGHRVVDALVADLVARQVLVEVA